MSADSSFTEEELFLLASTPALIGTAMIFVEGSGVFGTMKEAWTSLKSQAFVTKEYPDNRLIQTIIPTLDTKEEFIEKAKEYQEMAVNRLKEKKIDSHETLRAQLLEDCQEVAKLLTDKSTTQEAQEYKEWIMTIAENVSKAAKEGSFLGFGGERVSEGEKILAKDVAQALGSKTSFA